MVATCSPDTIQNTPSARSTPPTSPPGALHPDLFDGLGAIAPYLRAQGVGAIVTAYHAPLDPDPATLGFAGLFLETADFYPPDLYAATRFIARCLAEATPVVVHCYAGIGRTGSILAASLLHADAGISVEAAITRVRDEYIPEYARGRFPEHPRQEEALRMFAVSAGW